MIFQFPLLDLVPCVFQHELKVKQEEEEARARDRERLVAAVQEGAEFSGVIARSKEMMERRRTRAVSGCDIRLVLLLVYMRRHTIVLFSYLVL